MVFHIIVYLFIRHTPYPATACSARNNAKKIKKKEKTKEGEERKKTGLGQRAKPSISTLGTDVLIGEEEQNKKQKEDRRKKQEVGPNPAALDHSVAS